MFQRMQVPPWAHGGVHMAKTQFYNHNNNIDSLTHGLQQTCDSITPLSVCTGFVLNAL